MKKGIGFLMSIILSVFIIPLNANADADTKNEFAPEVFYYEILNEQRPEYAEGYRFLDLDGDGIEELLISEKYHILAIYTADIQANKPVIVFSQAAGGIYHYEISGNGIVCYNPSPNMHGQAYGHIYYRISEGTLIPIVGYIYNSLDTIKQIIRNCLTIRLILIFQNGMKLQAKNSITIIIIILYAII